LSLFPESGATLGHTSRQSHAMGSMDRASKRGSCDNFPFDENLPSAVSSNGICGTVFVSLFPKRGETEINASPRRWIEYNAWMEAAFMLLSNKSLYHRPRLLISTPNEPVRQFLTGIGSEPRARLGLGRWQCPSLTLTTPLLLTSKPRSEFERERISRSCRTLAGHHLMASEFLQGRGNHGVVASATVPEASLSAAGWSRPESARAITLASARRGIFVMNLVDLVTRRRLLAPSSGI
jgi:hypothetical protein